MKYIENRRDGLAVCLIFLTSIVVMSYGLVTLVRSLMP